MYRISTTNEVDEN